MYISLSSYMKRVARAIVARADQEGESPYRNIFIYQHHTEPTDPSWMIDQGPPSMKNEPGKSERGDPKNLMQYQQGKRPGPIDPLLKDQPMLVTVQGDPKENVQGEVDDNVKAKGRDSIEYDDWCGDDNNRDTIGFDPGTLNVNPFEDT